VRGEPPGATVSRRDTAYLGTAVLGASQTAAPPAVGVPAADVAAPVQQSRRRSNLGFVLIGPVAILALSVGIIIGRAGRDRRTGTPMPDQPSAVQATITSTDRGMRPS
jgi:hypothetical protein